MLILVLTSVYEAVVVLQEYYTVCPVPSAVLRHGAELLPGRPVQEHRVSQHSGPAVAAGGGDECGVPAAERAPWPPERRVLSGPPAPRLLHPGTSLPGQQDDEALPQLL